MEDEKNYNISSIILLLISEKESAQFWMWEWPVFGLASIFIILSITLCAGSRFNEITANIVSICILLISVESIMLTTIEIFRYRYSRNILNKAFFKDEKYD